VSPQRFSLTIPSSLASSLSTLLPPFDLVVVDKIATSVALGLPLDEAIYTALMMTTMLMLITVDIIKFIELKTQQLLTIRLRIQISLVNRPYVCARLINSQAYNEGVGDIYKMTSHNMIVTVEKIK
jgi:hypothetical protein